MGRVVSDLGSKKIDYAVFFTNWSVRAIGYRGSFFFGREEENNLAGDQETNKNVTKNAKDSKQFKCKTTEIRI